MVKHSSISTRAALGGADMEVFQRPPATFPCLGLFACFRGVLCLFVCVQAIQTPTQSLPQQTRTQSLTCTQSQTQLTPTQSKPLPVPKIIVVFVSYDYCYD